MALEKKRDIEELADRLTSSADEIRTRLMQAINNKEVKAEEARVVFQHETTLRQQANSLLIDAAKCVVTDVAMPQKDFIAIIDEANKRIAKVEKIAAYLDLVTDILALASAAYAAKPKPILAALKEVKDDLKALPDEGKAGSKKA